MPADFFALASFVVITTFTPGPNNITSASMGILHGYKNTLRYISGIASGFFLVMLLCGLVSSSLLRLFPAFESALLITGAIYILWLAFHTFKASYAIQAQPPKPLGFPQGFSLQLLNPKVIVYGLTLYATFLGGLTPNGLFLSALVLAGVAFTATSTWTLFGASIRKHLDRPRVKVAIHAVLSLLLVYTALELSGLLDLLFPGG